MLQFINTQEHVHTQLLYLGWILTSIAVLWFVVLVWLFQHVQHLLQKPKVQLIFRKSSGFALIGFGVKIVV
ncbi:LysE family transporter [Paenibacillus kyungheensis]